MTTSRGGCCCVEFALANDRLTARAKRDKEHARKTADGLKPTSDVYARRDGERDARGGGGYGLGRRRGARGR